LYSVDRCKELRNIEGFFSFGEGLGDSAKLDGRRLWE
jgi:hypothetical protein